MKTNKRSKSSMASLFPKPTIVEEQDQDLYLARIASIRLEPELAEIAGMWSPARRLKAAKTMRRWAQQLKRSAERMKPHDIGPGEALAKMN